MRVARLVFIMIFALFFSSYLSAKGLNIMGTDSRSTGLAGALAGETIGAEASFYNPAGFGFLQSQDFFFAYLYSKPYLKFTPYENDVVEEYLSMNPDNLTDLKKKEYHEAIYRKAMREKLIRSVNGNGVYRVNGFDLGVAVPFGAVFSEIKGLKDAGGFGLTLYSARFDNSIHLPLYSYDNPYYLNYSYRPLALDLNIGAGINIGNVYSKLKGLTIGGGVNIFLDVFANIAAYIPHVPSPSELTGSNLQTLGITFMTDGYVDEPYALTPIAGIQYKISDNLKLGFTYRRKFYIDINADALIHVRSVYNERDYLIPANVALKVFYDPDQYCLGGSYKVNSNLEILVEGDYNAWSEYIYPFMTAKINPESMKSFIDEYGADNNIPQYLTDIFKGFLGPVSIGPDEKDLEKLKDTITVRLGAEWKMSDRYIFDFGYYYDQNPVVDQSKSTNLLAADTHSFSFAFTYKLLTSTFISFHTQFQYLVPTDYKKDESYSEFYNPNDPLDPAKKLNKISNPGYPGYEVSGGYLNVGLTVTKRWGTAE